MDLNVGTIGPVSSDALRHECSADIRHDCAKGLGGRAEKSFNVPAVCLEKHAFNAAAVRLRHVFRHPVLAENMACDFHHDVVRRRCAVVVIA